MITTFSPSSGVAGATLTVTGTDLENATNLLIGSAQATIITDSSTSIQTTIPPAATTSVISLTTTGGKTTTTRAIAVLKVSSFAPSSGPYGTLVTITGSGFNASSTVTAGGAAATVVHEAPTQLQVIWPQVGPTGPLSVTNATAPLGISASSASFTVTPYLAPTVTSFSPASGNTGSPVTITGTYFSGASSVKFGTRPATYTVVSPTQINATVPNASVTAPISVATAAGTATAATSYVPALSITGVSPVAANAGGHVTLNGIGFTGTSTVTFNGTPAVIVSETLPTQVVVSVPTAAPGGPITVTNTDAPAGTVDSAASFDPRICGVTSTAPTYRHVIVIMDENHSLSSIIGYSGAPYINTLAAQCGLASNYQSITHPSLPEYMAATSGLALSALNPFLADCIPSATCNSTADNLFHQASSWKGYAETMPANCALTNVGMYAPRHNPAVYYTDLANCATNDVSLGTTGSSPLLSDFQTDATAPAIAWVTPNLCDDMHGQATTCPPGAARIQSGDSWLKQWLPLITSTPVYQAGATAIFLVWDEGSGPDAVKGENCAVSADPSCRVPALVIAPSVKAGARSTVAFNHYSLLRTIEDLLGLPALGSAATATSMSTAFGL